MSRPAKLLNNNALHLKAIPETTFDNFRAQILEAVQQNSRVAALFAAPKGSQLSLFAVLAETNRGNISVISAPVLKSYPSLTLECPQVHLFEREMAEEWGIEPEGHPWLKPVRFPRGFQTNRTDTDTTSPQMNFFSIKGEEVHEVAVGPVHAGIIEPGHFRFQCHGETVHHLEIVLGYQHRGIEARLKNGPDKRTLHYLETLAGDTTIGHAGTYCRLLEALTRCHIPARAQAIRDIALELERLANHVGDLGAMAGDIGFLPTMSFCGRIRGNILNLTALICGNRFGRRLVIPGGTAYDLDQPLIQRLHTELTAAMQDAASAINLLWTTPSVLARFENTGILPPETAVEIGMVGPAARASGLQLDTRYNFPFGIYQFNQIPVSTWHTGDIFARAFTRWLEIQRSAEFIHEQLDSLPPEKVCVPEKELLPEHLAVSLTEGWRGEICHVALTDFSSRFSAYKIIDPSFHNWLGLALAMRGQQISDFPLCNKSFNLSYCGHDL